MRYTRTRAGCLTCRSRRKKCDEVKPRCAGCRRNQLPCDWPSTTPCDDSDKSSRSTSAACTGKSGSRTTTSTSTRCGTPNNVTLVPRRGTATNIPMNVPAIHRGAESDTQRACMLTPQSVNLLSHFLMHTASCFAMGPLNDNPFVTLLVPLASTDDLLMHALLALSGAHLTSKDPTLPIRPEVARATSMHYSRLIGGLRSEFSGLGEHDLEKKERLLRLLMVACHYEAVSGNAHDALFSHLCASSHLVTSLVGHTDKSSQLRNANVSPSTLGFSIEMYTYIMLCNTIVMPLTAYRHHVANVFIMSFDEMADFPTFGSMFAGAHELYRLIPEIGELAAQRLSEEAAGSAEPSAATKLTHDRLHDHLSAWKMPPPSWAGDKAWEIKSFAAEVWRHALHIYLTASLAGSIVPEHMKRPSIVCHMAELFKYVQQILVSQQHYIATLLWPVVVGGSCIMKPEPQQGMLRTFRENWSGMRHMGILADVLQLMWDDPDPRAFGPHGLSLTMQKHGKVVGIL